jgi:hypothetical protein
MNAEVESRPVVGLTGARFGNVRRRGPDRPLPEPVPTPAPDDPVGQTGARFGGAPRRRRLRAAAKAAAAARDAAAALAAIPAQRSAEPMDEPTPRGIPLPYPASAAVRPYVLTTGRTRSPVGLSLETLVSAVPTAAGAQLAPSAQHRAAMAVCRHPRSVAEIAARLGMPLGVAAVLLGDLATAGLVVVHRSVGVEQPDLELMRRVLHGLRRL